MNRNPRWSHAAARLILSKLDGALDIADIAALSGVAEDEVERTLEPLIAAGLVALREPSSPPPASRPTAAMPAPSAAPPRRASGELSPTSTKLPQLSEEEHLRISELYAKLKDIDHYRLLGVAATADTRTIKRAYFALAKLHHPDRFFRKDVGVLRTKLEAIFAAMTNAVETLSDPERRARYDGYLREVLKTRMVRRNAESLEAKQDWLGAAGMWARVVESLPTEAYAHNRYAYALLRARQHRERAINAVERAIELDPKRAEYRLTAASLYLASGRERSALSELEVACELEPDRPEVAGLAVAISERIYRGSSR